MKTNEPKKGDIKWYMKRYIESLPDVRGKLFLDIPAGHGHTSGLIHSRGGHVEAYDLSPEFFDVEGVTCSKADLREHLPVDDGHADWVICQEGIEHLSDQLFALREFNRVLKKGGRLVVTTPNGSHLRARLSHLLLESDLPTRLPPSEVSAIWQTGERNADMYFGHIFLLGIQRLRVLARISGFRIVRLRRTALSRTSLLLGGLSPLILASSLYAYFMDMRRRKELDRAWKRSIYHEILRLNLDPKVLFCKHLFVELRKEYELADVGELFYRKLEAGRAPCQGPGWREEPLLPRGWGTCDVDHPT
jgi:SAM-dependent methyltransferase